MDGKLLSLILTTLTAWKEQLLRRSCPHITLYMQVFFCHVVVELGEVVLLVQVFFCHVVVGLGEVVLLVQVFLILYFIVWG